MKTTVFFMSYFTKEATMKPYKASLIASIFLIASLLIAAPQATAEKGKSCPPDKELCAQMIRQGKEAYWRGKYVEAKAYFRRAIQADPESEQAWQAYDLSAINALGQKVERNMSLIQLDPSARDAVKQSVQQGGAPQPEPETEKKEEDSGSTGFTIIQDEGC
jgi:tetratricopeptide (TPR) repeat protein